MKIISITPRSGQRNQTHNPLCQTLTCHPSFSHSHRHKFQPHLCQSDMSPQLLVQVSTVPDPVIPVSTVLSPPISDLQPILQPLVQVPMQVPTVPSPPISDISPIIQPPAWVPTFPNQALFPGFPNFNGTFTSTSDSDLNINPQQSLMDLMSKPLYG